MSEVRSVGYVQSMIGFGSRIGRSTFASMLVTEFGELQFFIAIFEAPTSTEASGEWRGVEVLG